MKLLASDFDNTLWFHDHMKERDVKTIKEFQKQGNLFLFFKNYINKSFIKWYKKFRIDSALLKW